MAIIERWDLLKAALKNPHKIREGIKNAHSAKNDPQRSMVKTTTM